MKKIFFAGVFFFFVGALATLAGMLYYNMQKVAMLSERVHAVISRQQEAFYQGNELLYGTVTAVDPISRKITAVFDHQFVTQKQPTTLEFIVASDAYIARQELLQQDGVNVALSEPSVGTLENISAGDNIAVVMYYRKDIGRMVAVSVLYGNPL